MKLTALLALPIAAVLVAGCGTKSASLIGAAPTSLSPAESAAVAKVNVDIDAMTGMVKFETTELTSPLMGSSVCDQVQQAYDTWSTDQAALPSAVAASLNDAAQLAQGPAIIKQCRDFVAMQTSSATP